MEYIPNEILSNIFSYSSKRAIIEYSKVCKKWHQLTLTPQYYSTVHIYTIDQLKKFLMLANNNDNMRLINNKPIGLYINHLHIHIDDISTEYIIAIFKTFPNIQSIKGLRTEKIKSVPNLAHIFNTQLQHITHFSAWYTDSNNDWKNYINDSVTLLDLELNQLTTINENEIQLMQQQQMNNPSSFSLSNQFYMKQIGEKKEKPMNFNDVNYDQTEHKTIAYNSKIIILPRLNHLITLKLQFFDYVQNNKTSIYEFDERTFESIHQSCPKLEYLEIHGLNMNISEEGNIILKKLEDEKTSRTTSTGMERQQQEQSILTFHLANNFKHLHFSGIIHDPKCYTYFLSKYPQLTTLNLQLECNNVNPDPKICALFKSTLFDLITRSLYLKSLEFKIRNFFKVTDYSRYNDNIDDNDGENDVNDYYWPAIEFSTWLRRHPNQLTTLIYPYDISTIIKCEDLEISDDDDDDDNDDDDTKKERLKSRISYWIPQTKFLSYLKCLSINVVFDSDYTWHCLSLNGKRKEVSLVLEELQVISKFKTKSSLPFSIYSLLGLFPNLLKLKLIDTKYIADVYTTNLREMLAWMNEVYGSNLKAHPINKLVKKEKKGKGRVIKDNGSYYDDDGQYKAIEKDDIDKIYKLQELVLENCSLFLYYGFSSFSKKFPHITKLTLNNVDYGIVGWQIYLGLERMTRDLIYSRGIIEESFYKDKKEKEHLVIETTLDLSNLNHLDYLYVSGFKYIPWIGENYDDIPTVVKLNIEETSHYKRKYSPKKQNSIPFNRIRQDDNNNDRFYEEMWENYIFPSTLNIICKSIFDLDFK